MSKEIIKILKKETKLKEINLEVPPDASLGDFAFPCFPLAKTFKKNPVEIAKELSSKVKIKGVEVKAVGPYLNFFVDKQEIARDVIGWIIKDKTKYGMGAPKGEKVVVEFLGPNTNKSLHVGHLRNSVLGLSLSNILSFYGYDVVKVNLNNDRGRGISEAILGYMIKFSGKSPKDFSVKSDRFVAECYVEGKKLLKSKPALEKEVDDLIQKWENNDKEVRAIWKKMMKWVLDGYKETLLRIGVEFDKEYFESDIYTYGKDIVKEGLKKKVFKEKEGAVIAPLEKFKIPDKVVLRSDGTSLYITQDIYLAKLRYEDFDMERMVYVVGSEQELHFKQLFKILEMLKFPFASKCYHLQNGMVSLESGKMKSREGTVVDIDNLLDDMKDLAVKEIEKRHKLSKKEISKRAEQISIGAVKFFFAKYEGKTAFVFKLEEALSFEGETGPYVQYAHARICSIFEKYGKKLSGLAKFEVLKGAEDEKLIKLIAKFPDVVKESAENYKPHLVARYLLDLSQGFNEFYHSSPILNADEDVKKARLFLILGVKQVLSNGLNLLGIEAPEKM